MTRNTTHRHDTLIEISPDKPPEYAPDALYAVRQHHDGCVDVVIVSAATATRMIDGDHQHVMIDGTINWASLSAQEWDALVLDSSPCVDASDVTSFHIAAQDEAGDKQ